MPSASISNAGSKTNEKSAETSSLISSNTTSELNAITDPLDIFLSKFTLKVYVYDYDRGFMADDLIGYENVDLTSLKENV